MSEFTSPFVFFTTAVDPAVTDWTNPDGVLNGGTATTWDQNASLEVTLPKFGLPGGIPVINAVTINTLTLQITWRRGGDATSGGTVRLQDFNIGQGIVAGSFSNSTANSSFQTDNVSGDATFWLSTQQQLKDFVNGDTPFSFFIDTSSINGSTQTIVANVKAQVQYTYTGGGVAMPIRF